MLERSKKHSKLNFFMWIYVWVFFCSFLVDLVPFIGPPAWTVMVFFLLKFQLDVWTVLIVGVTGSALGRYLLALYMPWLSAKVLNAKKESDLSFLGTKLSGNKWRMHSFVLLYTLTPLPSTPLFTVAGISKINPLHILPAFFIGKFTSDALMVYIGKYAAENFDSIIHGMLSWKAIAGSALGIALLLFVLLINWRMLLQKKTLRISFRIWK